MKITTALIALGSNVGERAAQLVFAVEALAARLSPQLLASPMYETAPVGMDPDARPVLNAACRFDTAESPTTLVRLLLEIEHEAGRVRGPRSAVSADRALDLDLLLLGNRVSDTLTATVPHPRVHRRAFVLVPACDIAPEMLHPLLGRTLKELLERLPEAERSAVLAGRRPEPLSPPESAER